MALDDVLARLGEYGLKKTGAEKWKSRCPAHADSNPSLDISIGGDRKVLAICRVGCDFKSIATALGLKPGDFFSGDPAKTAEETLPPEKWPLVAEYVYESRAGDPLYRVQRRRSTDSGRKTFRQHRADGNGGWLSNMDGAELVLYRLPEIAETDGLVVCCEGEKDCDNLAAIGLSATTNVGGAGKWLASYGESLRGRDVVILPDNDEPGEKHAALVLRSLGGIAARVGVLKLPDLPAKGDVSDWLQSGGTRQELERLAATVLDRHQAFRPAMDRIQGETSERISLATDTLTFGIRYLDDAMGGISRRDLILVGAQSGAGKCLGPGTPVLRFDGDVALARDVRAGDLLMGPDSTPRRVISTATGRGPMFRIVPIKGDAWTCNDVHVLTLVNTATNKVTDEPLNEFMQRGITKRRNSLLFRVGVEFSSTGVLPVDPYFLGIVIGDGSVAKGGVRVCKEDAEVAEECERQAQRWGLRYRTGRYGDKTACHYLVGKHGGKRTPNPLFVALRELGLETECASKRVPAVYLKAPRADRLQVLAGLLDTDGSLSNNGFDWISASSGLASDVVFLARSVGLAAYSKECRKGCQTGAVGTYYRVSISGNTDCVPMRIPRKKAAPRLQIKSVLRTGFSVEPIGDGDYAGFELDGDGRFLLGDFTVTHNTQLATIAALSNCRRGRRVHYFALEAEDREIERRIKYQILAREYYSSLNHGRRIRYLDWCEGRLENELGQYSDLAEAEMRDSVAKNLHTYYRVDSFTSEDFAMQLAKIAEETDLVVLDHLHYVDHEEDENENKGYKRIVKQIRDSALRLSKPVIVVAHIRKMDRKFSSIVPGLEDFHGSSDIGKISTKAITIAPDFKTHYEDPSLWSTFVHVAKCRRDSTLTRYVAKCNFNTRTDSYQELYSLGRMIDNGREYRALSEKETPSWAIRSSAANDDE